MLIAKKIVTARNTSFRVGDPLDTAENSPKVTKIFFEEEHWAVVYSNGDKVTIGDVVERWNKEYVSE